MSSEEHISEAFGQQDPPFVPQDNDNAGQPGMGQSKSSRRRRRKRKNKTVAGQPQSQGENTGAPDGQPATIQAAAPQSAPAHNHQQQGGGSGKRWKKKFRDRNRGGRDENPGNSYQPGNTASGYSNNSGGYGGGFKRKGGKQRKDRSFVGPMDHSYRATNGNFADSPPSTIEVHGNHNGGGHRNHPRHTGDSQPIDYSQGRAVPIPEGTPTKIYFFIEDLFFFAKIQETARKLGVKIAFLKAEQGKGHGRQ